MNYNFNNLPDEKMVVYGIWTGDMEGGSIEENKLYKTKEESIQIATKMVEEKNSYWTNHINSKGTDEEDYGGMILKQVSETVWTTGDERIEIHEFEVI